MNSLVLSIDPGKTCGLAYVHLAGPTHKRLAGFDSADYWDLLTHLDTYAQRPEYGLVAAVVVEAANALPIYREKYAEGGVKTLAKIGRNVGQTDAKADHLLWRASMLGWPVIAVKPKGEKWDDRRMREETGYAARRRTNKHNRDAIRNAWRLTRAHVADAQQRLAQVAD
ncbi:MAG: hypothetical protein AAFP15_02080 [Bacteroidota bacterium]